MPIFWRIVTFLLYSVRIILCLNQIKKEKEMDQMPACPKCKGEYVYHDSVNFVCPDCGNEWNGNEAVEADEDQLIVKDSNGNLLADGDDVLLTKDFSIKRAVDFNVVLNRPLFFYFHYTFAGFTISLG